MRSSKMGGLSFVDFIVTHGRILENLNLNLGYTLYTLNRSYNLVAVGGHLRSHFSVKSMTRDIAFSRSDHVHKEIDTRLVVIVLLRSGCDPFIEKRSVVVGNANVSFGIGRTQLYDQHIRGDLTFHDGHVHCLLEGWAAPLSQNLMQRK